MPDVDRRPASPLSGPLARLHRDREALAKAWLVRVIERASLEEIKSLPTDRIAAEVPELIADVLGAAGHDGDPFDMPADAHERASKLAELRDPRESSVADLTRDVTAIQAVILESLRQDAEELGPEALGETATRIADAVGAVQAAAVETLAGRRSRELEALANSDPLTGLSNLRDLEHQLHAALALHKRYEHPFSLLVLDIDGLKRVNAAHGHTAGDRVLVQVALAVRRTIRAVDTPARIGGDEFCVLAPHQTAAAARPLAERLAEAVRTETATSGEPGVDVSIGVVSCPEHGDEPDPLLAVADQAMYRAKAGGGSVSVGDGQEPQATAEKA